MNVSRVWCVLGKASLVYWLCALNWAQTVPVGPSNGIDDTMRIQAILNRGWVAAFEPGTTYHITTSLVLADGSGLVTLADPPATLLAGGEFNATQLKLPGEGVLGPREVVIRSVYPGAERIANVRLERLRITRTHLGDSDRTRVTALQLRGVTDSVVENVEIFGFCLGSIVRLESVERLSFRRCAIHDCWASGANDDQPQLTGIDVDDARVFLPGFIGPVDSRDLLIANNTISRLRFKKDLFGASGYQTDGIQLQGRPQATIVGNIIDTVGEGIDSYGSNVRIEHNVLRDCFAFGLKVWHGGSDHLCAHNIIERSGFASIVTGGSSIPNSEGGQNCFGNIFRNNVLIEAGNFDAFGSNAGPFDVTTGWADPIGTRASIGVWGSPVDHQIAFFNIFFDNLAVIQGGRLFYITAEPRHTLLMRLNWVGNGAMPSINDSATTMAGFAGYGTPDRMLVNDFDGNGELDLLFTFDTTGFNWLFRKDNRDFQDAGTPIPMTAINASPDNVVTGDFNNDGRGDVMFHWRASGANRLFLGTTGGSFVQVDYPIAPTAVDLFPGVLVVGNYAGDVCDDIFFYDRLTGENITFVGSSTGFMIGQGAIASSAINGNPDDVLVGDYNGDGYDDILIFWRGSGQNRFFFGSASGQYLQSVDPIPPASVNGGAADVWIEDVDLDARADITLVWPGDFRRTFLGQPNGTFLVD